MDNYLYPDACIAIFAKAPVPGKVKTRMQPTLTPEQSAQLQSLLISHTVNTATLSQIAPIQLWCAPDTSHNVFQELPQHLSLYQQHGDDLGQRMKHCFRHNQSKPFTILIGTDCPSLSTHDLHQAADALTTNEVCITPAVDGGYVLIGSSTQPNCLDNIDWGTEKVCQQSLSALQQAQQSHSVLRTLPDLDHPQDLADLPIDLLFKLGAQELAELC